MNSFVKCFLCLLGSISLLSGCNDQKDLSAKDPVWDRQVCDRCQMALSDRYFAAQILDKQTGKRFYFDDLGCALVWMKAKSGKPIDQFILYATAADSGKWLDVRKSVIARTFVTPMSYGFGVLKSSADVAADKKTLTFEQALEAANNVSRTHGHGH